MEELAVDNVQKYSQIGIDKLIEHGPGLVLALIVLFVGLWVIKRVTNLVRKNLEGKATDPTLARFLISLVSIGFKALLFISFASMINIETTSFVALLGAAGLAIGLALQGTLANFAGGVLILMFRPYRVGDFIDAQGITGTVRSIQIFNTILTTGDNKRVIVPNGAISNGIITNFSAEDTRRVDFVFGIGYDDDIDKAKSVLHRLIKEEERIFSEPESLVVVSELADSSVNFSVRTWVKASDYWGVYFSMTEKVKIAFDAEELSIPYPQTDVHLHSQQN